MRGELRDAGLLEFLRRLSFEPGQPFTELGDLAVLGFERRVDLLAQASMRALHRAPVCHSPA